MTSGLLGTLSFTYPWMLAGLAALPVIWLLLRLTPPRPQTVPFPPASLLLGLRGKREDPDPQPLVADPAADACRRGVSSPPWPARSSSRNRLQRRRSRSRSSWWWTMAGRRPAAGPSGNPSPSSFHRLCEESGQTLYLIPTAGPAAPLSPLTPEDFRQRFASLAPEPFSGRPCRRGPANREGA